MLSNSVFLVVALCACATQARPQGGGLFGFSGPNFNQGSQQLAAGGGLLTGLVTAHNIHQGNDEISFRPQVNLVFNPESGQLEPVVTGNVQVGKGFGSTSFGVGGSLANSGELKPVVTSSINGPTVGGVATPALTSGIAFGQQESNGFFGAGVNSDHLALNTGHSVGGLLSGNSNNNRQQGHFRQQSPPKPHQQQFQQQHQQQFQQQPQQQFQQQPQQQFGGGGFNLGSLFGR